MKAPLRITVAYLAFGLAWIFTTDFLVQGDSQDAERLWQLGKGSLFVVCSGLLVYLLTRNAAESLRKKEEARRQELRRTVSHVHHILLNYLNQMQLVTLEAEACKDFDSDLLALANRLSEEAKEEIRRLGEQLDA